MAALAKRDKDVTELQARMIEVRELSDGRVLELRETLLECQKDVTGQRQLNELLRGQVRQLELERNALSSTVAGKDNLNDKLKEEVVLMSKVTFKNGPGQAQASTASEARSEEEFKRLKSIAEQLKDAQVDAERARMDGLYKDREYNQLKEQLAEALESKNQSLRQTDIIKYENQKLKEEQQRFLEDLQDMRDLYESQITKLSKKVAEASETALGYKSKAATTKQLNSIQSAQIQDFRKRIAYQEVEIEKLVTEKVLDAAEVPSKARMRTVDEWPDTNYAKEDLTRYRAEDEGKDTTAEGFTRQQPWAETQKKLDWDSLMYKISQVGVGASSLSATNKLFP